MLRTALLSGTFVILTLTVLVGIGFAADIFSVDKDGTVRLRISTTGATTIAAADDVSPGLSVTQSGVASAIEASGRAILQGKQEYTMTGTVTINGTTAVTGSGTFFTREARPGDRIEVAGERRIVAKATDNQNLIVSSAFSGSANDVQGKIHQFTGEFVTTAAGQLPIITLTQDPSPSAASQAVYFQYQFRNDAGTLIPTGALLKFVVRDVAMGSEDVDVAVDSYGGGALKTDLLRIKGETGRVGIGTGSTVTTMLDINNTVNEAGVRIRSTKTPTSTADGSGNIGDIAWDASYIYIKTSAGWKRAALATW